MDISKEGKASQKKSHIERERENKSEAGTLSCAENVNNNNNGVGASVSGDKANIDGKRDKKETVEVDNNRQSSPIKKVEDCAPLNRTNETLECFGQEMDSNDEEPKASASEMEAVEDINVLKKECDELGAAGQKSHIKMTESEIKCEAGTSSKIVENVNNNNNSSVSVTVSGNKTNTDDYRCKRETVQMDSNRQSSQLKNLEDCAPLNRTNEAREHLDKEMQLKSEEPKASSSKMEAEEDELRIKCDELGAAGQNINEGSDGCVRKSNKSNQKIGTPKESFREMLKDEATMDEDASASGKDCKNIKAATQKQFISETEIKKLMEKIEHLEQNNLVLKNEIEQLKSKASSLDSTQLTFNVIKGSDGCIRKSNKSNQKIGTAKKSFREMQKDEPTMDENACASEKDCNYIKAATQQTNEVREHLDKEMQLKSEEPKASSSKMEAEEDVLRTKSAELGAAGQNINEGSDGCVRKSNKSDQKIRTPKESLPEMQKDEATMDEDASASEKNCNNIKAATQDKLKIFEKREGTGGIGGQLYEIYLVLLILIHGLTNETITHFHLASNLEQAGDFDDVVFSYTYKDLNGAEKIKVTFLQAKHKEKSKNISFEDHLLGTAGKGGFDLKKYFKSFRSIKKNFEGGKLADPIFGNDFEECEFIIYTNAVIKSKDSNKVYINDLWAAENWILNVKGERIKYYQLRFSENKNKRIKTFLESIGESEEQEFHEFLSKLKICTAQPNQDQLKKIIEEEIQLRYGVTRSDIETVFPVVKNKIEAWWKNSSEYLTEKNTIIQNAARFSIRFEVQDPVPGFTGRQQSLRDLHKALQSTGYSVISQSASITGLGGVGKTELARKYVSQYSSKHYDNNVIWINAETYSTSSESFRRLARDVLGIVMKTIDGEDKDITCIKSEVYAFFAKRNKKSLFIFDNAENPQDGATALQVTSFLPSGVNKPHVLITSRNQQWGGIKSLQLDLFTEEESARFIKKHLSERGIKCEDTEIKSLAKILQNLPLALRQAVAYIAMENERLQKWNKSYTIENYLNGFKDKARTLLGKAAQDVFDTYAKTVLTTWQVTIEKIKQNETYGMQSELILNIIAFFAPDNIPIVTIFGSLMGEENVIGSVEVLEQYSLVKLHDGVVSIHRLLQHVIRMMLQSEGGYMEVMERTLCLFYDDISTNCIIHVRSVWDYAKNLNKVVEKFSRVPLLIIEKLEDAIKYSDAYSFVMMTHTLFKDVLGDCYQDTLMCLHWKSCILRNQGKYNEAEWVCQELLQKQNAILGPDHPDTLRTKHHIAFLLDSQGKYEESLILYQEVLCKKKEILGPDHPQTLATIHNMASVLEQQGKYEESLILYQEVLCKNKEILGPDHPDTLTTIHNMAFVLLKQGKYEESLILYQEVLCKNKEILGPDHPQTLATIHNIALVLEKQGKYEESLILYQEVLCKNKEILGPDHPQTLATIHNMASVLEQQGKYEESLILYQEVLCKNKEILGPDHPQTLTAIHNMASVLEKQGKYEESLILYQEVLCKNKEILGPDHPQTLATIHNIALVLEKQGKYEESLIHYQEVLCKNKEILGPDHPQTLTTIHNMAFVLLKQGKYEESLILYQEVLCKNKEILGPDHPDTLTTIHNMASVLEQQGKYEESLILYQEVLCKNKEILGPDHPQTLTAIHNMASVLEKQGKYEESLILYQEVLCKNKEILGPDHPQTLATIHNMASVLEQQGKYEESLILYQEVLCKKKEISGPDHPETLATIHNMAFVLLKQGKYEESLILYQEVLCKKKEILGPDHPETLATIHNMAFVLEQQGKYEESLILYQEVLCKNKEILGPDHPQTLTAIHNMASVLEKQGKYEESLILCYRRIIYNSLVTRIE